MKFNIDAATWHPSEQSMIGRFERIALLQLGIDKNNFLQMIAPTQGFCAF